MKRHPLRTLATIIVLVATVATLPATVAEAKTKTTKKKTTKKAVATKKTVTDKVVEGGSLVFGAEQEPGCADFFGTCVGTAWGRLLMASQLLPRAFDFDDDVYKPSVLLAGMPTIATDPFQVVTYKLNPKAVWSDGEPITSADFVFTWTAVMKGTAVGSQAGYNQIQRIETPDAQTVVVHFKATYASWRDIFGGSAGVLPQHILKGKDRNAVMKDGFTWSGGPWLMDHWTKGQEFELVRNKAYWGQVPHLDSVTFKFVTDTGAQMAAFKSGQVTMIYPQAQIELAQLKTVPNTSFMVTDGLSYEGLRFNLSHFPLDNPVVREALGYAIDRQAIVTTLFGPVSPGVKPGQGYIAAGNKEWAPDSLQAFKRFKKDVSKVNALMTGDGWKKGNDGIWQKFGDRASLTISTTAGNKRRELTEQLVQGYLKDAGFELGIKNQTVSQLLGPTSRSGDFDIILSAAIPASNDPSLCSSVCSWNIPSTTNASGTNTSRINDKQLDEIWQAVDTTIDPVQRAKLVSQGQDRLGQVIPGLPLDDFPDIVIFDKSKIGGPVKHNVAFGPWANMNYWYKKG